MAESEIKSCQSCQVGFTVDPEDFAFYTKMQVPPPTWCPTCRLARRLSFTNEWRVFQKPDALTGVAVFSNVSPTSKAKIYVNEYWYSDAWDPLTYGKEYDFNRPFLEQFKELFSAVPLQARNATLLENSDYCVMAGYLKNCYLVSFADYTQDSAYMVFDAHSKNCFDTMQTDSCELCYGSVNLGNCYQAFYCLNCENSREVILSKDLIGCSNCFGCVGLRNKQFHIFNQPYTEDEYRAKLKEFGLHSQQNLSTLTEQAHDFWLQFPNKFMQGSNNEDVSGEYISNSKNAHHCYRARSVEDGKYAQNISVKTCKEVYDYTGWGATSELMYEDAGCGDQAYNIKFSQFCWDNVRNLQYSAFCLGSSDLFGCVSLRKKQFCILNKQYTESEYNELVPKIIEHMNTMPYTDTLGRVYRYGEFFPTEFSPLEYNITAAQEHFPLNKDEALAKGYTWYEQPKRSHEIQVRTSDLPDSSAEATSEIVGQVIECAHQGTCDDSCSGAFTIIAQELAFLIEQGLPLPRHCFACRHAERITQRRPIHLQTRQCDCQGAQSTNRAHQYTNTSAAHRSHEATQACPTTFETSFSLEQPEIVYCEACYQSEVS